MCWHKFPKWSDKVEVKAVDRSFRSGADKQVILYSQERTCLKCNLYECRLIGKDGTQIFI